MTARTLREKAAAALLGASITTIILGLAGAPRPYTRIAELAVGLCAAVAIGARLAEKRDARRADPPNAITR